MTTPKLILHGGAGSAISDRKRAEAVEEALGRVRDGLYEMLSDGASANEVVVEGCRRLEDDQNFNAGTGSVLQSDGQIRMSAALMSSEESVFSGIVNATRLKNPIELAAFLQDEKDRVLAAEGATELMRELGTASYDPMTEKRLKEWIKQRKKNFDVDMANVVSDPGAEPGHGTIGVVALDETGEIAAATSTGGRGFERIGRVSDSAMPAGNYARPAAGVSCTGIGEDIIDDCAAARIVVRVKDGMKIRRAFEKTFDEAERGERSYGAIGIDANGNLAWGKTTDILLAAWHSGRRSGHTLDLADGQIVEIRTNRE